MVVTRRQWPAAIAVALAALISAWTPAAAQMTFSDQTASAGLTHMTMVQGDMAQRQMFSGGAVGDFDRDGWPDLFLLGGGVSVDSLYINNGDGTFTDRAADWGIATIHRGHGAAVGDFNNDGWPDIYVTTSGSVVGGDQTGKHKLYRNEGGASFTDIAFAAGVNQTSGLYTTSTGAAFGDYDMDGDLDLFVCGWEALDSNRLFRNNGDETFTDTTLSAGVGFQFYAFTPRFVDMNGDRYPEILIASDFTTSQYYVNNQDGTFSSLSLANGTGQDTNGMGQTVADFNRDGLPDWYVTSIYADTTVQDGNYLYINQGNDQYIAQPESAGARNGGWGWGADARDFDHDGYFDLVETNGWMPVEWLTETSYLFRNNGDLTFSEYQGGTSGFDHVSQGRTVLTLDYDRDGDMDVVLTGWDEPVTLMRNEVSGPNTNWIVIQLDTDSDPGLAPEGQGARVIATTGVVTQYAWIDSGTTYLGTRQRMAHFGLGSANSVDLTIEWADGSVTSLPGVAANQMLTLSSTTAGAPGEASMQVGRNATTGEIEVEFEPACGATNHTVYYGDLAQVATYGYSGSVCWRGNSGFTSLDPGGLTDAFFLIVGNTGLAEGPYGSDSDGNERPEETAAADCELPQDLTGTCDLP